MNNFQITFNSKKKYINWKYEKEGNPLEVLLELFPKKKWNWNNVSYNPNITITYILAHPNLPWEWICVSQNRNISLSDILSHPELPWDWGYVSKNPNTTVKDILSHPELLWKWSNISRNEFLWNDTVYKNNLKKDIKKRREQIRKLALFETLKGLVERYVGYV